MPQIDRPVLDPETVTLEDLANPANVTVKQLGTMYQTITGNPLTGTRKEKAIEWCRGMIRWRDALEVVDEPGDDDPEPLDAAAVLAAAEEAAERAGTDVAVIDTDEEDILPEMSRWQQILAMAEVIARANVTPKDLRGKPADVAVVMLAANDLRIPITQALQKIGVVDGKLVMMAELMVALVRRDGHTLSVDAASDHTGCVVHGRRIDSGEVLAASFTLQDAKVAGLIDSIGTDGYPVATSQAGGIKAWQKYPTDMLYARAVSRLCRRLFPDVLGGVSYTPEELGDTSAYEEQGSDGMTRVSSSQQAATITVEQQRETITARIERLPEEQKAALRAEWKRLNLPKPMSLSVGAMRQATKLLDDVEATIPDEVELVDDQGAALDAEADAAIGADGAPVEEAVVVLEDPNTHEAAVVGPAALAEDLALCESCDLPIQPGEVVDNIGETKVQPVYVNEKPYHADCAPF